MTSLLLFHKHDVITLSYGIMLLKVFRSMSTTHMEMNTKYLQEHDVTDVTTLAVLRSLLTSHMEMNTKCIHMHVCKNLSN